MCIYYIILVLVVVNKDTRGVNCASAVYIAALASLTLFSMLMAVKQVLAEVLTRYEIHQPRARYTSGRPVSLCIKLA